MAGHTFSSSYPVERMDDQLPEQLLSEQLQSVMLPEQQHARASVLPIHVCQTKVECVYCETVVM